MLRQFKSEILYFLTLPTSLAVNLVAGTDHPQRKQREQRKGKDFLFYFILFYFYFSSVVVVQIKIFKEYLNLLPSSLLSPFLPLFLPLYYHARYLALLATLTPFFIFTSPLLLFQAAGGTLTAFTYPLLLLPSLSYHLQYSLYSYQYSPTVMFGII